MSRCRGVSGIVADCQHPPYNINFEGLHNPFSPPQDSHHIFKTSCTPQPLSNFHIFEWCVIRSRGVLNFVITMFNIVIS